MKLPVKLSVDDPAHPHFICVVFTHAPGDARIVMLERHDSDFAILAAYSDGTPQMIFQKEGMAWFQSQPTPEWRFVKGAKATAEVFSDGKSDLLLNFGMQVVSDNSSSSILVDLDSILGRFAQPGVETVWGQSQREILFHTRPDSVTRLQVSEMQSAPLPVAAILGATRGHRFSLRIDGDPKNRTGWSSMRLSEAARLLNAKIQTATDELMIREFHPDDYVPLGASRRRAWQILDIMQIPSVVFRELPRERIMRALALSSLQTGELGVKRFCIDQSIAEGDNQRRFHVERNGEDAAVVVETADGLPVALYRQGWVLSLDADRGWILFQGIDSKAEFILSRKLGPNAFGVKSTKSKGPGSLGIEYPVAKYLKNFLDADWKFGADANSLQAADPANGMDCALTLADERADCSLTSVRFSLGGWSQGFKLRGGEESTAKWTSLNVQEVKAALNPVELPWSEQTAKSIQALQLNLPVPLRVKSQQLMDLVTAREKQSKEFKRLP